MKPDAPAPHPPQERRPAPPSTPGLPAYQLYGEPGSAHDTEQLHLESILARSQLHDWEIRPHRHPSLFQILYIRRGRVLAWLEGSEQALAGPGVITVPAMSAHGFRFEPGVDGQVITVQERHLGQLLAQAPGLLARFAEPTRLPLREGSSAASSLRQMVQALADEYGGSAAWRLLGLDSALLRLMLGLARALPPPTGSPDGCSAAGSPALAHAQRYQALVESRFRLQPRVADLAAELGITATQLNRVCQSALGQSALAVLHGRMLLEAQRQLTYTTLSVKRIGLDLGFADPGYFTRFFQRGCGLAPSAWRQRAQR